MIFNKITLRSAGDEVVNTLREAIIDGKLKFGEHLTEAEISQQMNISRIPIREAFRLLEQEGLVTRQPNRGCFVITFSPEDVVEVFTLRASLESMGFEWIIDRLTASDFQTLSETIRKQEAAIQKKDYATLARMDMQFHEFLLEKTQHSRLIKAWNEQHAQCRMLLNMRFNVWAEFTPETVVKDHTDILNALRNRDIQEVTRLTKTISERVTEECIQALEKQPTAKLAY